MKSLWSDEHAATFVKKYAKDSGQDLALRTYSSRLLGMTKELVLHGGGNTSVKGEIVNIFGQKVPAIFIKASGQNLAKIAPDGHPALDLTYLRRLQTVATMDDATMLNELRTHLFHAHAPNPSMEALLHAFLPAKFIDHTHPDAILTLTNQVNGAAWIQKALGDLVIVLPYVHPGFRLAQAVATAFAQNPQAKGMVLMKHGLLTWGATAQESYEATCTLVSRAETVIQDNQKPAATITTRSPIETQVRYQTLAPILRGALAVATGNPDRPHQRFILSPMLDTQTQEIMASLGCGNHLLSSPITSDHLIRLKPLPLWIDNPSQITEAVKQYQADYQEYFKRSTDDPTLQPHDASPRVIFLQDIGVICVGRHSAEAEIARDMTRQTLQVKANIAAMGDYEGLSREEMFQMEYFAMQVAKLPPVAAYSLVGNVALVTGAAGAIGSGICRKLLEQGCQVAATDLAGDPLDSLVAQLAERYGQQIIGVAMDVTDPDAVAQSFNTVVTTWGGVDLVVVNAGLAHVASLAEMKVEAFRKLHKVNVEGTLHVLAETARLLKLQGTGGDVVMISTKNVFAPGANFGAYSATKAAAHQLARIASLELANDDIRVNMVSPDAVFADGPRKSGLWAEVGPDRMRARGLDEAGLEAYYRNRNLLKVGVTAEHVANAVLFFATRQTPTTGATIPVDGGLPDATPR